MNIHKDITQGTDEWFRIRRGMLTASNFKSVITPTGKLANSEKSRRFIRDLVIESFISRDPHKEDAERAKSYNFAICWGNDHEEEARQWFRKHWLPVETVGFVKYDNFPIGCSPDGLIPEEGNKDWEYGLEIKCPSLSAHVGYLESGTLPDEYRLQVHGSMAVTGLSAWYFLSYHPNEKIRNFIIKVERDEFTAEVEQSLIEFVDAYRAEYDRLLPIIRAESEAAA